MVEIIKYQWYLEYIHPHLVQKSYIIICISMQYILIAYTRLAVDV